MNEGLNGWERMKNAFEGFEPDVTAHWEGMRSKLIKAQNSGSSQSDYFARRAKIAERFALGATAVAAGLVVWLVQTSNIDIPVQDETMTAELILSSDHQAINEGPALQLDHAGLVNKANNLEMMDSNHDGLLQTNLSEDIGLQSSFMAKTSKVFFVDAQTTLSESKDLEEVSGSPEDELMSSRSARKNVVNESMISKEQSRQEETDLTSSASIVTDESDRFTLDASVQEACAGTEVSFALRGLTDEGSVLWNFGDGSFSQEDAPMHVFDDAGTYDITVSIRDHTDGTIRTRKVENMIVVRPKPDAKMDWSLACDDVNFVDVRLFDQTENASSSTWLLGEKGMKGSEVSLSVPGVYNVNLVASNTFGCQDVKSETIHLGDRMDANAPGVFSPNNDGRYDEFLPLVIHECDGDWNLTVYDDKDQVGFQSNHATRPWDGSFENGLFAVPNSSYRWELNVIDSNGKMRLFSDQVKVEK
jgi:hypothetical protein